MSTPQLPTRAILQTGLNLGKKRTFGWLRVVAARMQVPQAGLLCGLIVFVATH